MPDIGRINNLRREVFKPAGATPPLNNGWPGQAAGADPSRAVSWSGSTTHGEHQWQAGAGVFLNNKSGYLNFGYDQLGVYDGHEDSLPVGSLIESRRFSLNGQWRPGGLFPGANWLEGAALNLQGRYAERYSKDEAAFIVPGAAEKTMIKGLEIGALEKDPDSPSLASENEFRDWLAGLNLSWPDGWGEAKIAEAIEAMVAFAGEDGAWILGNETGATFYSDRNSLAEPDYGQQAGALWEKFKAAHKNIPAEALDSLKSQILGDLINGKYANIKEDAVPGQGQFEGFDINGQDTSKKFGENDTGDEAAQKNALRAAVEKYLQAKAQDKGLTLTAVAAADVDKFISAAGGYQQNTAIILNKISSKGQDQSKTFGQGDANASEAAQKAAIREEVEAYLLNAARAAGVSSPAITAQDVEEFITEALHGQDYEKIITTTFNKFIFGGQTGELTGNELSPAADQEAGIRSQIAAQLNNAAGSLTAVTAAEVDAYIAAATNGAGIQSRPVDKPLSFTATGSLTKSNYFIQNTYSSDDLTFKVSIPDDLNDDYEIRYKVITPNGKVWDSVGGISRMYDWLYNLAGGYPHGFGDYQIIVTVAKKAGAAADVPPIAGTGEIYRFLVNVRWPIMGGGPEVVTRAVVPKELKVRHAQLYVDELAVAADTTTTTDYYIYGANVTADTTANTDYYLYGANITVNTSGACAYTLADRDILYSGTTYKKLRLETIPGVPARNENIPFYRKQMDALLAFSLSWDRKLYPDWLARTSLRVSGEIGWGALFYQQKIAALRAEHEKYLDQIRTQRGIDEDLLIGAYPFYNAGVRVENIYETGLFAEFGLHNFLPKSPQVDPNSNWLPDGGSISLGFNKEKLWKLENVFAQVTGLAARFGEPNTEQEYSLNGIFRAVWPINNWLRIFTAHNLTVANTDFVKLFDFESNFMTYRGELGPNFKVGKKSSIGLSFVGEYCNNSWFLGGSLSGKFSF